MGVVMVEAGLGTPVKLRTEGGDGEARTTSMLSLFERKFDEGQ